MRWTPLLALVAACAAGGGTVTGVVVEIEGDLERVESFTVVSEGDSYVFIPAPDGEFEFPLPHLRDHLRTADPVRVEYRETETGLETVAVSDG